MSRTNQRLVRRMQKEIMQLREEKQTEGIRVFVPENIMSEWVAYIRGPSDSQYEGCIYRVTIKIVPEYPFKPPQVLFRTGCWHPNIGVNGHVCLDILTMERWAPSLTLFKILQSLQSLLTDADPTSPLNAEAAREWRVGKAHEDWTAYRANVLAREKIGYVEDREFDPEKPVAVG